MHPARKHMELARTSVESINRGGVNPRNQANLLTSIYAAVDVLVSEAEARDGENAPQKKTGKRETAGV